MSDADTSEAQAAPDAPDAPAPDPLREELVATLGERLGDGLVDSHIASGVDLWVRVATDAWADAATAVRDTLGCRYFTFLSAIDWLESPWGRYEVAEVDEPPARPEYPDDYATVEHGVCGGETRFQVLARVYNIDRKVGLTLKTDVPDDSLTVDTWIRHYGGAAWHERETHEMFGISFAGNPDLRKLYLPSDFEGYPLRKDFPLVARQVKPWPGIVDVEPMPASPDDEAEEEAEPAAEAEPEAGNDQGEGS